MVDDFVMTIDDSDADVPILDDDDDGQDAPPFEGPAGRRLAADDAGLDSDFEFQTGHPGDAAAVAVGNFDGWALGGDPASKGVDIDDLIRRRRSLKDDDESDRGRAGSESGNDGGGDGDDEDEGEVEFAGFGDDEGEGGAEFEGFGDDDEDIAADGFGMGVPDGDADNDNDDDDDDSDGDGHDRRGTTSDSDDSPSDGESVASEVAHPDDDDAESGAQSSSEEDDAAETAKKAAFFAADSGGPVGGVATFEAMNLSRPILRGLADVGFVAPTPIQRQAIPAALLGKDVVGGAQTGSGKTAAFVVPILERLLFRPRRAAASRVLILCPTRELALQAHAVAVRLAAHTDIGFALAVGGLPLRAQEAALRTRPDVIVATPGRFVDHLRNAPGLAVDTLEIVVLDEADRMLEDGFAAELDEILAALPPARQTLLFSATMTDSVDRLVRLSLTRPVRLLVDARRSTAAALVQEFVRVRPPLEPRRLAMLVHLCRGELATAAASAASAAAARCIVFFRSKVLAHRVRVVFGLLGLRAAELHGALTQPQRVAAVAAFRDGHADFLLATDLAARGLDIPHVAVVVNYDAPQSHDIYLHRVGRTARAGRAGRAVTLAGEADRALVRTAVRAARAQGARVVARVLDAAAVGALHAQISALRADVDAVLADEKIARDVQLVEMQLRRAENLAAHRDEIRARPRRTWFSSSRDKARAQALGRQQLNGTGTEKAPPPTGSGRKRKHDDTEPERGYKKTRADRIARGKGKVKAKGKIQSKGKAKAKAKGKGKGAK